VVIDLTGPDGENYKRAALQEHEKATCIVVPSHSDLIQKPLSANLLEAWVKIVALGGRVCERGEDVADMQAGRVYDGSVGRVSAKFGMTARFERKHPRLAHICNALSSREGAKWRKAAPTAEGVSVLDDLGDLRKFLLSALRCKGVNRVSGRYATAEVFEKARGITRYGPGAVSAA
jgi:hypothetical protein